MGGDQRAQGLHRGGGQLVKVNQTSGAGTSQLRTKVAGAGAQVDILAVLDSGVHLGDLSHFLIQGDHHVSRPAVVVGDDLVHTNLALVGSSAAGNSGELGVTVALHAGSAPLAEAGGHGGGVDGDLAGGGTAGLQVVGPHGLHQGGLIHNRVGGAVSGGNLDGAGGSAEIHAAAGSAGVIPNGGLVAEVVQAGIEVKGQHQRTSIGAGEVALGLVVIVHVVVIPHAGNIARTVHLGGAGGAQQGIALTGGLVAHDSAGAITQAEVLIAQGGVLLGADHAALHAGVLIAEGQGVLHHGHICGGTEQHGSDHVTAGSQVQGVAVVGGVDVAQDAQLGGGGANLNAPGAAGELVVLVVAHSAQDHRQDLIAGHVAGGVEGGGSGALDDLGVVQVAHIARVPGVSADVGKGMTGGVQVHLAGAGVAGHQTVDDGGHFRAGDVARGTEAAAVTLEDAHAGEHFHGLAERRSDISFVTILRADMGGVGGHHHGERHNHRQDQREELFQVSHRNCFLLYIFARISELFSISGIARDKPSRPPSSILPSG